MLTRTLSVAAVALLSLTLSTVPASAGDDDPVVVWGTSPSEAATDLTAIDRVTRPGATRPAPGAASTVGNKTRTCSFEGSPVDCESPLRGGWDAAKGCWVRRVSPQPPATDPIWNGRTEGAIYTCTPPGANAAGRLGVPAGGTRDFWAPADDVAGALQVDPVLLAEEAIETMNLRAVEIGITPPPGPDSTTLVGLPTWMWVEDPDSRTWGPITRTASAGSVTVTATAKVTQVVWDMGDGTTVSCGEGTAYEVWRDADPSPTCGHQYRAPGEYAVTATSSWEVDWAGAGQSGTITFTLTRDSSVRVSEAFALVTKQG